MSGNDTAQTFWERYLAVYRFCRNFGRRGRWSSFLVAILAAWKNETG